MTKPRFPQRDFWTGIVPSSPSSVQSRCQARRSLPTSRLLVTYLDRDIEFVWTLKHLDKTSWQRSSSVQIKPLPRFITRPLSGLGLRACELFRERFTQHLRCHRPFHESWHKCVHEAIQSARNYSGPVFPQRVKALGYALLHAHWLHRHGPRVEPKLGQHRRVCQRGLHDDNVDAPRLELVVERFPETVDIRLGATVIRQERNPNFRAHRPYEDKAAPASLGEFRAEMVGDIQMRHRIEPQGRLKQLPIELQELARIWGAGIGDDKADVEIVS